MRILVTGGTGFVGSAFVRAALSVGHELAIITRGATNHPGSLRLLNGSIAEPPWREIERFAPDACVHAAWIATPGVYLESLENHDWIRWSFDFASRLPSLGVRHITVLGTCIEYEITGQRLVEDTTPLAPASTYARCKCALHEQLRQGGLPKSTGLAWARLFYPYGKGEHPERLLSMLIAKLQRGEPVTLRTPRSTKDYIHVDDVGTALLHVMERQFVGAINIGTGDGVTVESTARELARLLGRSNLVQVAGNPPADPLDYVVADATRLRTLGWRPCVTLAAGLRQLVETRAS
ncbi:MAG: NAD(P)-dependent oxidoreductase [Verrucomicrobiae bacterium]|nr:NAD(P)-dependent oxidoreductase [Verrucomicrobiae bacterium]